MARHSPADRFTRLSDLYYEQASDMIGVGGNYTPDRAIHRGRTLRFHRRVMWTLFAASALALSASALLYLFELRHDTHAVNPNIAIGALVVFVTLTVTQATAAGLLGAFSKNADQFISIARRHRKIVTIERKLLASEFSLADLHAQKDTVQQSAADRLLAVDFKDASDAFANDMRVRLGEEIESRRRSSLIYFSAGIISVVITATLVGVLVFSIYVNINSIDSDKLPFLVATSPLSITFLSAISFFFFVMSRHYDTEGKFFQNELSTAEMRLLPWAELQWLFDDELRAKSAPEVVQSGWQVYYRILERYASTERNFVLKRGETTSVNHQIEVESKALPKHDGKGEA